jgi:hypothetical protein
MTSRKRAVITSWRRARHTSAIKGSVRVVHPILSKLDVPWMWDATAGCYLVSSRRIDDVLAALEFDGYQVDYLMPGW